MKILMVAIPNHHFFQWIDQLKGSGYEIFWFDITDGGPIVDRIDWIKQFKGWKLRWDFPFRTRIKNNLPRLYRLIQKYNERKISSVFSKILENVNPDIVHCFEMKLSGLPILSVMKQNSIPFMYSSWGSDMFNFENMHITNKDVNSFLTRTNYLITDCKRDHQIAINNGFDGEFLGVYPGNGGLNLEAVKGLSFNKRKIILIKGYDDGIGKASKVLEALSMVPQKSLQGKNIVIYSADVSVVNQIKNSKILSSLPIKIHSRYAFVPNKSLMGIMGKSCIHIANSLSDGMPNSLLEAMAMGAFPIQSNPGRVTEEVIIDNKNGLLINEPLNVKHIASLIEKALNDEEMRKEAQKYNRELMQIHYNRATLQPIIVNLYKNVKVKS